MGSFDVALGDVLEFVAAAADDIELGLDLCLPPTRSLLNQPTRHHIGDGVADYYAIAAAAAAADVDEDVAVAIGGVGASEGVDELRRRLNVACSLTIPNCDGCAACDGDADGANGDAVCC